MRRSPARLLGVATLAAAGLIPASVATADAAAADLKLSATSAAPGAVVTVKGTDFKRNHAGWVKFRGSRVLNVRTNSVGRFSGSFKVPAKAPTGFAKVLASVGSRQDSATFSVRLARSRTAAKANISLSPTSGPHGTKVTIKARTSRATTPAGSSWPPSTC